MRDPAAKRVSAAAAAAEAAVDEEGDDEIEEEGEEEYEMEDALDADGGVEVPAVSGKLLARTCAVSHAVPGLASRSPAAGA
jgi:hypothetical protein